MTVIPFPQSENRAQRIRGIQACLAQLRDEAETLGLPLMAHLLGVTYAAAEDACDEECASSR